MVAVTKGEACERTVTKHKFNIGDTICNIFNEEDCITLNENDIKLHMEKDPKVYVKKDDLIYLHN